MKAYRTDMCYNHPVMVDGVKADLKLPDGCIGICYIFKTKTKARNFLGNSVLLTEVSYEKQDSDTV